MRLRRRWRWRRPNIFARYKSLIKFNKLPGGTNSLARLIKICLRQADSDVTLPPRPSSVLIHCWIFISLQVKGICEIWGFTIGISVPPLPFPPSPLTSHLLCFEGIRIMFWQEKFSKGFQNYQVRGGGCQNVFQTDRWLNPNFNIIITWKCKVLIGD